MYIVQAAGRRLELFRKEKMYVLKKIILILTAVMSALICIWTAAYAEQEYSAYINVAYDSVDATDNIRRAIIQAKANPGRERIVLSNQGDGVTTWISGPIYLGNDMELYLEENVTLQAKSGAFPNYRQPFVNIGEKENVTIAGENSETSKISMPIEEYTGGEMRHGLNIAGAKNIIVKGVTLEKSGGDGIYISDYYLTRNYITAMPENILIEDVIIDGAARNGLSIIAGDNILVNNCTFENTGQYNPAGLASEGPWAGIDWETEGRSTLKTTKVYNCKFINNRKKGFGFAFYRLKKNDADSPFVADVKNCTVEGSPNMISGSAREEGAHIPRYITVENCYFDCGDGVSSYYREWGHNGLFLFKDTIFNNAPAKDTVFSIYGNPELEGELKNQAEYDLGNLQFDNVSMYGNRAENLITLTGSNAEFKIKDVTGTIYSDRETENIIYDEYCDNITVTVEKTTDTLEQALSKMEERGSKYVEEGAMLADELKALIEAAYAE